MNISRCLPVVAVTALSLLPAVLTAPSAADPTTTAGADFYLPPDRLPESAPGDILRAEPLAVAPLLTAGGSGAATAQRIMYRSNDTHDAPAAVTGTYFEPSRPWTGPGARPVVALAPGTQGQGDQCAPSKLFEELIHFDPPLDVMPEFEVTSVDALLSRGVAVVVTDYLGLGTPAVHDYVNRRSEAHAVLDAARAALRLPGTSLTATSPVAIMGYSQGGGGAAAAAEMQPSYAPELDVRGAAVGAPPADLLATMHSPAIESGPFGTDQPSGAGVGLFGYISNSIATDYPQARQEIDQIFNADGKAMLAEMNSICVVEGALRYMYRSSSAFTTSGRPISAEFADSAVLRPILDEQRIGGLTPAAPVLITSSTTDDVIPYPQVRQLAVDWCAGGANVTLDTVDWIPPLFPSTVLGHGAGTHPYLSASLDWLTARLSGVPATSGCQNLPN
ncbi:lipase family protein [Nocardia sp. NPDC059228]|uniref:lipase family protein n=1 Tax=Nocardia sp. NPDC059228 TaxID=3346777 RepID=UPI0036C1B557